MFVILEREYEWYEKDMWSDPCLYITERVLDVANERNLLIEKYMKEEGWEEKIDDDDPFHLKRYEKYDDHGNKVQRVIVGIGDEFITEEVY